MMAALRRGACPTVRADGLFARTTANMEARDIVSYSVAEAADG